MPIIDSTAGVILAEDVSVAGGFLARARGLMFRRRLPPGEGLLIRPCASIHMLGMRFPIDAVFFDRELRVTKVARRLRPWLGVAFGGRSAVGVVELPAGAAAGTRPGHLLQLTSPAANQ